MQFVIGAVTSVKGTSVRALINPNLYQTTYIHDGKLYRGVSINEYIVIKKGYHEIVGKIEGEEIIEKKSYNQEQSNADKYDRFIDLKIIGYVQDNNFQPGIKYLPMIQDGLYLASDTLISAIYTFSGKIDSKSIEIGKSLLEDIPIRIPINGIFNSHLGIFGNTGSGKSNTLAKLYIELFNSFKDKIFASSRFMFIDFNGEYRTMHNSFIDCSSYVELDTHIPDGKDKLFLKQSEFWDAELLSVLFSATEKTQKPFLNILTRNRIEYGEELNDYFQRTLQIMFGQNQHRETISVLRSIIRIINPDNEEGINSELAAFSWFSRGESNKYYLGANFPNTPDEYLAHTPILRSTSINSEQLSAFEQLSVRATLQLIQSVSRNYVQYEHISPLIGKINASAKSLEKVIKIIADVEIRPTPLTFISLKNCNQDIKKTIPMMIAKCSFLEHKRVEEKEKSFHLIIDEAHNILSESSVRESETWKDYRLELFEEIIKEGRKFGFFITISSQRPADISPTIVSQIHNYFLHRLVNDNDIFLLKNSLNNLDSSSRSLIPSLPSGACVLSGTAFHTPVVIQIERLSKELAPESDTIDLDANW
ncbi:MULTISPECIES: ATP-binding protein [Enterobacterales]|uniref:ATP-binding protein n=1 Tax=Enterobacterales TaxID=91347 RepID=UPI001F27A2B3|nr:ATP-binding protein [Escherichia coli]EKL3977131.1 ATP-binding protein [Morganella morganii]ELB1013324.1 ATP-binding protein [Morganella morganii]ELB1108859.1 ATP-binding protein [Morganella morganii]